MVRLSKRLVRVDLRDGFTLLEQLLETEQVTVDALAICSPRGVLEVSRDRFAEQRGAALVLGMDNVSGKAPPQQI